MHRVFSAALILVALGLAALPAAPVHAQVVVPQAQADRAIDHMRKATAAAERVTAILLRTVNDPAYSSARDAGELSAAISGMRADLSAGRREIRQLSAELSDLPRIAQPSDPAELRVVDQIVGDIASFSLRIDAFLGVLENLGDALEAGDQQRTQQLAASLIKGSVAVVEGQSLMLRARLPMMPSDSSNFAEVSTLACFYDGFAHLQTGAFEIVERPEAAAAMSQASACMADQIAKGRLAVEREAVASMDAPVLDRIRDGLAPVRRAMFTELENGLSILDEARTALLGGASMEAILEAYGGRTAVFEQRFQALVTREVDVVARQGE